ncbi:MAG: hypothetical protein M3Q69_17470, partial [Acidobacteriota bacterium]|nr:hypothetical protein [Acidobacteriota bacterium]
PKPLPDPRRFAQIAYDAKLKKTVLFGGFFGTNYRNDTWTWDGTKWEEVKIDSKKRPPHRGTFAMWYDPLQQKTLLYGGIGRGSVNENVTRYADMWAFNGTTWTKLEVSTPGQRLGPQIAVNPNTGRLLLFGGLRAEPTGAGTSIRQFFANDTWEWDGAASRWTELHPATVPDSRENGGMAWDPAAGRITMFAGYADGFYRSDLWYWTGADWQPLPEPLIGRRRAANH